jgi:hypothetical protein
MAVFIVSEDTPMKVQFITNVNTLCLCLFCPDRAEFRCHSVLQEKKTIAEGVLDLALFLDNLTKLRYIIDSNGHHDY